MNTEQKKRIIRQFLQANSLDPQTVIDDESLERYTAIGEALSLIEASNPAIFDMETIEQDPEQMRILFNILQKVSVFDRGSPPALKSLDMNCVTDWIKFHQIDHEISGLPGCDYYNRPTDELFNDNLNALIILSREKLKPIILDFLPELDITNKTEVEKGIKSITKELEASTENSPERLLAEQKLAVLNDLKNINELTSIMIPQEKGSPLIYCTLAEKTDGANKKISLIHRTTVIEKLQRLVDSTASTVAEYSRQRDQYKLRTEAILKLPKHGEIKEVQREAMALNISRILGNDTTRSTMVSYKGNPALFVPFDSIRLLKDMSSGKTFYKFSLPIETYTHYSTITPVGEGLEAEDFTDDFGHSLGLFYLCSDTDAVGGYGQNKAVRDNHLYVFDQVLTDQHKLGLDSRLSMQPIKFITKHTRHDQGRNRTLIEDSSMETKFESLLQLQKEQAKLLQYCDRTSHIHSKKIQALDEEEKQSTSAQHRSELKQEIATIRGLQDDVALLRKKIKERIDKINDIIPTTIANAHHNGALLIRQTYILEKLINIPVLFADDGRPYRNPWTQRNNINAVGIHVKKGTPNQVKIKFDKPIHEDVLLMLQQQLGTPLLVRRGQQEIMIQEEHLLALNEAGLFPEMHPDLDVEQNYLNTSHLNVIKQGYGEGLHEQIIQTVKEYTDTMSAGHFNVDYKLKQMCTTEQRINECIHAAKDKGFGMHVLKKFQCDAQQRLQQLIPREHRPEQINQAFSAAIRLDQVSLFNAVVREAIKQNKLTDPVFTTFLTDCINKVSQATNHFNAQTLSSELKNSAEIALQQMKTLAAAPLTQPQTLARLLHVGEDEADLLSDLDPIAEQEEMLTNEAHILAEALTHAPPADEQKVDNKAGNHAIIKSK